MTLSSGSPHAGYAAELADLFPERAIDAPPTLIVRAPGRVNLIGEHTDYNGGFVLPFAIDMDVRITLWPTEIPRVRLVRADTRQTAMIDLTHLPPPGDAWHDYVAGTAWALRDAGQPLHGFDGRIVTTLPIGSGLSSSAALEIVSALALSGPTGPSVPPLELARIAQRAENEHVGVQCGLMDQFASACGVAEHALLLDCRSTEWRAVPMPADLAAVAIHSGVSHAHGDNEYNARRAACERVVAIVARDDPSVTLLRDVDMERISDYRERLDPVDLDRATHVITENARVLDAVAALEADDHAAVGELMAASQASMRDLYAITCPEIDELVAITVACPGVIGSRMTGGGFGGCTVSLVELEAVDRLRETVEREYPARTGKTPRLWVTRAVEGAGFVEQ
jgi:galactokinase